MTPHQRLVAARFLDAAHTQREPVVVALSGAHAFGFPSPDSDVDLKAVHIAPTRALLGLRPDTPAVETLQVVDGIEIDYSSHELGGVLQGALKGNGNYLERLLVDEPLVGTPLLAELRPLVQACLSRRVHGHYRGFALHQRREAERTRSAKKVLYVLRTCLTGAHLLRTGEILVDVTRLAPHADLADLLAARAHPGAQLLPEDAPGEGSVGARMDRAFAALDDALAHSVLPAEPAGVGALEAWLVETRLARAVTR